MLKLPLRGRARRRQRGAEAARLGGRISGGRSTRGACLPMDRAWLGYGVLLAFDLSLVSAPVSDLAISWFVLWQREVK